VIVVGVMATSPFAIAAVMWWGSGPLETARVWLLFYLGFWMVFGAATAIYASHKITTLRREVAEARKLGPYKLVRKLGSGGMGEVYLAEHSLLKRPCAVKLIRPERAGDPQALRRFEREVQTTASLTHPSTIQVYDYGHTPDGTFYYAMEYIPGLPLDELVRRAGLLPTGRVVHVLLQLCGALAEAHAAKLVHRDIKPGNVILGERGGRADVAKLLDFGLVTAPTGGDDLQTREGTITGTPAYMSPEQAAGRGEVGPASDIYSLGAVAYFLLTGRTLFPDRSVVQVLGAHLYETPDPPGKHRPDLPADLEEVVVRCLAKKPADRFPDVGSLESALARCAVAGSWSQADAANWWRDQAERRG
jgi:serine/threonine-protein kinase